MNDWDPCTLGMGRLSSDGQGFGIDGLGEKRGGTSKEDRAVALSFHLLERG